MEIIEKTWMVLVRTVSQAEESSMPGSVLLYGALIWTDYLEEKWNHKKLDYLGIETNCTEGGL